MATGNVEMCPLEGGDPDWASAVAEAHAVAGARAVPYRAAMPVLLALSLLGAIAEPRVRSALVEAGLSEGNARCMAGRMTQRLSIGQLLRLRRLSTQGRATRTLPQYVAAVRAQGDVETVAVTVSSAALCATGLAR